MKKIALFNHKGGVGKTTLTVNIADALATAGRKVLLVDADPQCNLSSFYLRESDLEKLLVDSDDDVSGETLWSAVKPVVEGRGAAKDIGYYDVHDSGRVMLLPGDVLLSDYEEVLPEAWTECFARRVRGYDVTNALASVVNVSADRFGADVVFYDVGPNVGALNRAVLLDCDYFITPVAADLFSLRALSTVGRAVSKWITDWQTIRSLASPRDLPRLFNGMPAFSGYITSAFKVNAGRNAANPHKDWEKRIAPRVRDRISRQLSAVDPALVPHLGSHKVGAVKHFQSLAPEAQKYGVAIGRLKGSVNPGHNNQIHEASQQFSQVAAEIIARTGI